MSSIQDRMKYSPRPLSDDQLRALVPAAFAEGKHSSRSENYGFVRTSDVIDEMEKEGFVPFLADQMHSKVKPDHCKHIIRFRHADMVNSNTVGGYIPEVALVNSHDGTTKYMLYSGVFRIICSNGLVTGSMLQDAISIRHSSALISDVIDASYKIIESSAALRDRIEVMRLKQLNFQQAADFAQQALEIKYKDKHKAVTGSTLLEARRTDDKGQDLWSVFNVVQENLIKGGLSGESSSKRQVVSRPLVNIDENIRVNRDLWNLAETYLTN